MNNLTRLSSIINNQKAQVSSLSYATEVSIQIDKKEFTARGDPSISADDAKNSAVDELFKIADFVTALKEKEDAAHEAKERAQCEVSIYPDYTKTMLEVLEPLIIEVLTESKCVSQFVHEEIEHAEASEDFYVIGLDTEGKKPKPQGQDVKDYKHANIMQLCGKKRTVVFLLQPDACEEVQKLMSHPKIKLAVADKTSELKALNNWLIIDGDRLIDIQPMADNLVQALKRQKKNPKLVDIAGHFTGTKMCKFADRNELQRKEYYKLFDNVKDITELNPSLTTYAGVDAATTKWAYDKLIALEKENEWRRHRPACCAEDVN
jgi:hypothetical protein